MNQIPNIEEWKKLAREKLAPNVTYIDPKFKEVASWAEELLNAFWVEQQKYLDAFIDTLHHQLQKAREDGYNAGLADDDDDIPPLPKGKTLDDLIKDVWVDHSELDHQPDRPLNSERD